MTAAFELPIRDDLRGVKSYGAPQLSVPVCLNVNENPFPLPVDVAEAITTAVRSVATDLNRYPQRDAVVKPWLIIWRVNPAFRFRGIRSGRQMDQMR